MESIDDQNPLPKKRRYFDGASNKTNEGGGKAEIDIFTPQPKRRFFDGDHNQALPRQLASSPTVLPEHTKRAPDPQVAFARHHSSPSRPGIDRFAPAVATFDQDVFEAIVGHKVEPYVIRLLEKSSRNDLERAVNIYFDGTWKQGLSQGKPAPATFSPKIEPTISPMSSEPPQVLASGFDASADVTGPGQLSVGPPVPTATPQKVAPVEVRKRTMSGRRYVGAFGVEGWTTRSGSNLLKHGDIVKIERQKIEAPHIAGTARKAMKLGPAVTVRPNSAAAKRVDVIVRFTSANGLEIGRLSKDTASWVSTLMDQKICHFEGVCVYAPERLRINETVFLQLRCWLLGEAFEAEPLKPAENRSTGLFEEKETVEERNLRLRQVALVRLLQEANLMPTKMHAAAASRVRRDLLQAAEMVEKGEKEASKSLTNGDASTAISSTAAPPDEVEDGQELEQDQLDALYRKAQSFDFSMPEAEPPDSFALCLRPYQKQALNWMLSREKDANSKEREASLHPLWEEYTWPTKDADDNDLPDISDQPCFYVNPYSGDLSLDFPTQEQNCLGGILADEMGLGKTIQMLSLIHAHKSPVAIAARKQQLGEKPPSGLGGLRRFRSKLSHVIQAPCTTLVVAPMSLLAQWQSEAETASVDGTLRSMVYYGNEKAADLQSLCSEDRAATAPDIIVTSYGTVLSEFTQMWSKNGNDGNAGRGLFSLQFFRIILDEAHTIKNRQSKTAKACYALSAEHRWVLTGTPVVNRLEDLFSLIRFLRVEPWNNFSFWRTFITVPFESKDFMRALDVVQTVLEPLVMRRTKDMKTPDGQPLVLLPAKRVEIVPIELSKTEREIYDHIYMRAKRTFNANVEAGTVMKSFTSIFAQVLRLRQCCCHPILVRNMDVVADEMEAGAAADAAAGLADDMDLQSLVERFTASTDDPKDANAFGAHVLGQIRDKAVSECPICAEEPMIHQTVTGCWHSACRDCLLKYIDHEASQRRLPRCFHCREVINRRDLFEVVRHDDEPETEGQPSRISLQRVDVKESSAKVVALIQHLRDLRREHPAIKSVVFSQFTSFMTLIEPALQRANVKFMRLDGTMTQKARAAVLEEFRQTKMFAVLLLSLRAGGVGLNLTTAKRVFMMDPWWSFSVEAQAIDRVHRMGQDEEVKVYRFIVKGSVEEKMLKIQDRKKFIATSLGMMSDEEKSLQRVEDIKELLS